MMQMLDYKFLEIIINRKEIVIVTIQLVNKSTILIMYDY